jgi:DNA mismatch repair protein MutL
VNLVLNKYSGEIILGKVVLLDRAVADKIAAGEVIERPASVIKELVENSIDAGAKNIIVNIENGGHDLMEIVDDGAGMSEEDAGLAIQRFATSKIKQWEDIETLNTFGFRGEALPSIAAISKMEIFTREKNNSAGYHLSIEGGDIKKSEFIGTPEGTRIRVSDIFYNTPARRKFLKNSSSETAHIVGVVQKLSLINEKISFQLNSNGREILNFPSTMSTRERVLTIWGIPLDYDVLPIEYETPSLRVSGYICRPDRLKSHRSYQLFFVNGRFIRNTMISQAVSEGFSPLVPAGKHPIVLVFIDMPGSDVDVNAHPNKLEVRFLRSSAVFKGVRDAISEKVKKFNYSPQPVVSGDFSTPFRSSDGPNYREQVKQYMAAYEDLPLEYNREAVFPHEDIMLQQKQSSLPVFRALTQVKKTYILGVVGDEIWIVDQHTAHERINYEKISSIGSDMKSKSQQLLFPVMLELPATLFNFLKDKKEDFENLGFEIEDFGGNSYLVKSVPFGFKRLESQDSLLEILEEVAGEQPYRNLEAALERIRSTVACKASVKAGDDLTMEEMNALVNELISTDYSSFCPHGRPVVIKLSKEHLDRMFHRI